MRIIVIISSLFLLLISPSDVAAAVIINEVAWMGGSTSANHEWIELYNNGNESEDLAGRTLNDGMNLEVELTGIIQAKDFAVLERTSEESALGNAFLIYTGALVNTGATLTLYNSNGGIADRVVGGENWLEMGGDNLTKETAQYTEGGWVTDSGTPGSANKAGRIEEEELPKASSTNQVLSKTSNITKGSSRKETVRLVIPNTVLQLEVDVQTVAYVNQKVNFTVKASGVGDTIIDSLNYTWNFGDTYTSNGKNTDHYYEYPGTYVVTVRGTYGRHDQVTRQEITILPVSFSLTKNEQGDIQIHNDAPYDVDISGFSIKGEKAILFPAHTIILPKGTITIKKSRLGQINSETSVSLYDSKKTLLTSTFKAKELAVIPEKERLLVVQNEERVEPLVSQSNFNFLAEPDNELTINSESTSTITREEIIEPLLPNSELTLSANDDAEQGSEKSNDWVYLALIGVLFLGFVGIMQIPKKDTNFSSS